jgi:hypothetical protein
MDWSDWTNWTHRMGGWRDARTCRAHRERELQLICSVVGYIHHSDGCVTWNDVLHYISNNYGNRSTWVHDGTLDRRVLGVSEQFWVLGIDYIDERNSRVQRSIRYGLVEYTEWLRNYTCILGKWVWLYCLLGVNVVFDGIKVNTD